MQRERKKYENDLGELGGIARKRFRKTNEPLWIARDKQIARTSFYQKYKLPTLRKWVRRLDITHLLRQEENWEIYTAYRYKPMGGGRTYAAAEKG